MFTLTNILTGYTYGRWCTYDEAECARNAMDDWDLWTIDEYD